MKKLISLILVVAMVASFAISVSAAEGKTDTGLNTTDKNTSTNKVDVIIDSDSVESIEAVYYVDVAWESLDFKYTFNGTNENVWDPSNHTYGEDSDAVENWDKTSADIVVTNHSNKAVGISAAIDNPTLNGVTATLSNATFDLDTGVGLTYDTADNDTITVSIAGVPTIESNFTIGTITVTVSAKQ